MERQLLQRHWRALAHWKPASWHLPLAVFLAGEPVGMQDLWAQEFARRRSVGTGSWITRARQGNGYGTEARAAVLDLAFGHLDAVEALTEHTEGNHASERVSRKLGYAPNGQRTAHRDDTGRVTEYQLRLNRPAWERHALRYRITVTGLAPCMPCSACPAPGTRHEADASHQPGNGSSPGSAPHPR
jgi:RimJ/RimL family protein N-acetyltransferase